MPGYTHLQRAQPITFGHALMAYASMLLRDLDRFADATARMDSQCPLGSGALAGTTYPLDRDFTAEKLGFAAPCANSLDGVSDRDFCIELANAISICMMHLSRLSGGDHSVVQLGSSSSLSWTMPLPPARPSCRRRRTPTLPNSSAARPAGCTAT